MSDSDTDTTEQNFVIEAGPDDEGDRLDRFLARHLPQMSRSRLKALIKAEHVRLNGRTIVERSG